MKQVIKFALKMIVGSAVMVAVCIEIITALQLIEKK